MLKNQSPPSFIAFIRRYWLGALKLAISVAVLAYLLNRLQEADRFGELWERDKNWPRISIAFALCTIAVVTSFFRWYWLVRCLRIPFSVRDAFRLGFLGYMFNFVSLGSVGGDLFKAVALVREHPDRKPEALSTVVLDRVVGLFSLLMVASVAILCTDLSDVRKEIQFVGQATVFLSAASLLFLALLSIPRLRKLPFGKFLSGLPYVGETLRRLLHSFLLFRRNYGVITGTVLLSISGQVFYVVAFYELASGMFTKAPSLAEHFMIVPLAMVASALPLPMGALGAFEAIVGVLYEIIPRTNPLPDLEGVMVALGYRAITLAIAVVGILFWISRRREVEQTIQQAEAASSH